MFPSENSCEIVGSELPDWAIPYADYLAKLAVPVQPTAWALNDDIVSWYVNYVFHQVLKRMDDSANQLASVDIFTVRSPLSRAQTFENKGHHGVAIYTGLAHKLVEIAKITVKSEPFRERLLLSGEAPPKDSFFQDRFWRDLEVPRNWQVFAEQLFMRCLDFVISHETGHILLNHSGGTRHREIGIRLVASVEARERTVNQLLELDADAHVVNVWVGEYKSTMPVDAIEGGWLFDLIALVLVLQSFDEGSSISMASRGRHPSSVHRAMMATDRFVRLVAAGRTRSERERVANISDEAWFRCSKVAELVGATRNRWWGDSTRAMGHTSFLRLKNRYDSWVRPSYAKMPIPR